MSINKNELTKEQIAKAMLRDCRGADGSSKSRGL